MTKVFRVAVLIVLVSLVARIRAEVEDDQESVCKMETKKGLVQLKEKYKERIQAWKELQKRGCAAKTDVKEANEGLEDCIIKKFQVMQDGRLKSAYLETYEKCLKKIAPIKDLCNESEQKERVYCFVVESRNRFAELCIDYIKDQREQRKMFNAAYECVDERLKKKGV